MFKGDRKEKTEKVEVFELVEEGVKVELLNKGREYISSEEYLITYEDFNRYLGKGVKRKSEGNMTGYEKITGYMGEVFKRGKLELPRGVVECRYEDRKMYITELVGGAGFFTIDEIDLMGMGKITNVDYGSIYEIQVEIENISDSLVNVISARKFTGFMYMKDRSETDMEEVEYLTNYLRGKVEQENITVSKYLVEGLRKYIERMSGMEYNETILQELEWKSGKEEQINWGEVFD